MEHRSFPDLPIEILAADNCCFVALLLVHMTLPDPDIRLWSVDRRDSRRPTGPLGKANRIRVFVPRLPRFESKGAIRMQVRLAEAGGFEPPHQNQNPLFDAW